MNISNSFFKRKSRDHQRGQSLVETAIILPILLLMFFGVIEVGWALRGYLVLVTTNRESVRYAIKNGKLDYSSKDPLSVGYDEVLSHTLNSLGFPQQPQLPLDFTGGPDTNATIIMSHIVIDAGFPCVIRDGVDDDPLVPYQFDPDCDCSEDDPNHSQWFSQDDLILHPDVPGYAHYRQLYGIVEEIRIGQGSYLTEAQKLLLEDNQINCTVRQTGPLGQSSANNVFIVEMFYEQPHLLGIPLISNQLTDPIPFYTHTAMRIVTSREASANDTIGPICELYPLAFNQDYFVGRGYANPDVISDTINGVVLFEDSPGDDDFDWVSWNPAQSGSIDYLVEALHNPRLAINDFTDPNNGDNFLSTNEVDGLAIATNFDGAEIGDGMAGLARRTIQVPVFDSVVPGNIDHIALLEITRVVTTTGGRSIEAIFRGYNDQACQQ